MHQCLALRVRSQFRMFYFSLWFNEKWPNVTDFLYQITSVAFRFTKKIGVGPLMTIFLFLPFWFCKNKSIIDSGKIPQVKNVVEFGRSRGQVSNYLFIKFQSTQSNLVRDGWDGLIKGLQTWEREMFSWDCPDRTQCYQTQSTFQLLNMFGSRILCSMNILQLNV